MRSTLFLLYLFVAASPCFGATVSAVVRDARGLPVRDAVVWAVPQGRVSTTPPAAAVMDQQNRMFIPHVLVVQTGASVSFPNSDDVQHQVYSFSPARPFQLPLYKGNPPRPVIFDKPGMVSLGCNIHDRMSAWIVVVDTPHFGTGRGRVQLSDLPAGRYSVHAWYPGLRQVIPIQVVVLDRGAREELLFTARR